MLETLPIPVAENEVLVKVMLSGICNTDIEIFKGYAGFEGTVGHEFVGIVECSSDAELIGKRVVGEINAGCGNCPLCLRGDSRHCPDRTVLGIKGRDGAHAEYLTLPQKNLYVVPDIVSDHQAVFIEPLAAAYGILEQVDVRSDTSIAVIGDGKLGLLCAFSLGLRTDDLILVGKHSEKLKLAEKRSIDTIKLDDLNSKSIKKYDVVVEASGSESGFATALDIVRPRGKIVLKSTFHGLPRWEAWRVVVDEITVVGSRCGRFEPALQLLQQENLQLGDLISDEFHLTEGIKAVKEAEKQGVMKILLTMI